MGDLERQSLRTFCGFLRHLHGGLWLSQMFSKCNSTVDMRHDLAFATHMVDDYELSVGLQSMASSSYRRRRVLKRHRVGGGAAPFMFQN